MKFINKLKEKITLPTYENRSFLKRSLARYRMLTYENRALPNFMIIGTQKGGTTSLYKYLTKHPDLKPNYVVKELSFLMKIILEGRFGTDQTFLKGKKGGCILKELHIIYTTH